MSSRIVVEVGQASECLELGDGEAVLVGREPELARIGALGVGARTVAMPLPSVSANHFVARRDGDTTTIVDTDSRNGTWLELPAGDRVVVSSSRQLHVRLAPREASDEHAEGPRDATWIHRDDYHRGVVAAIRVWFDQLGTGVHVTAAPATATRTDDRAAGRLPLANGYQLEVVPTQTVDAAWTGTLDVLWRYVNSQNATFAAEEETRDEGLILASPAIRRAHQQVVSAAQRGFRLLLIGPSGSGKDGLARAYHRHSRRSGAFVAKNCAMLGRELLRAELFGAEQGSFTGAVRRIVGAVEACHGGTLFLDEIGEMAPEVQPFLLTFLDRGEYERIGSYDTQRSADIRLVCATNKDLRAATLRGEFRDDLWYRLAEQVVHVPPLRERPEDLEAFLARDGHWTAFDADARARVLAHPWQGNFRELGAFAMRMPREVAAGSVGVAEVRTMLDDVALAPRSPPPSTPKHGARLDLPRIAQAAAEAFAVDSEHDVRSWDDVKECVERYLKPLVFAELSGAVALERREAAAIPALADAVDADRGTVLKQLNRYFERFRT